MKNLLTIILFILSLSSAVIPSGVQANFSSVFKSGAEIKAAVGSTVGEIVAAMVMLITEEILEAGTEVTETTIKITIKKVIGLVVGSVVGTAVAGSVPGLLALTVAEKVEAGLGLVGLFAMWPGIVIGGIIGAAKGERSSREITLAKKP